MEKVEGDVKPGKDAKTDTRGKPIDLIEWINSSKEIPEKPNCRSRLRSLQC